VIALDLVTQQCRSISKRLNARASAARYVAQLEKDVTMTFGPLRASAIALAAATVALVSPLAAANAATVTHHYGQAAHPRVSHGLHGYVARNHVGHHHYVWRNGHRYVYGYGYNPGAAVAAGVIGGVAAGYPYCDNDYGSYYGSCDDYSYGYPYPYYDYGYGFGGPVFVGRDHFHHGFDHGFGFHGDGAHFASGNFGRMGGFGAGHVGGFGGGHFGGFGGFGGGHMGGFGGGHFGGGGRFH
jgi:hypothetical protein